jgi:hypothetical protein
MLRVVRLNVVILCLGAHGLSSYSGKLARYCFIALAPEIRSRRAGCAWAGKGVAWPWG